MRAVHIIKSSEGARWAALQVEQLIRKGIEVHVLLPSLQGAAIPLWQKAGAILHEIDCSVPVRQPWLLGERVKRTAGIIREIKPDVVHSHFVTSTIVMRLALQKYDVPRIFQVPGPLHLENPVVRAAEIATANSNDYWVGSSEAIRRRYLRAGVDPRRVMLSYYGLTMPESWDGVGVREQYSIPSHVRIVGNANLFYAPKRYLGHRVGLKCHEDVVEALAEVTSRHDDVLGVLIGGPWGAASSYFEQVKEYARKLAGDRILFTGTMSHENVRRSWHDFDCAIHVPLSENCGGVVEPLAAGVPTIAGRVGGLPEVVVDSKSGLVVPIRNPRVLADAVEQVLQYPDYFRDLAQNGRALVTNMFEVSRTAEEIAGIYRHLVEGAPRPAEYNSVAELQRIALAKPPLPASSIPPPMLPRSLDSLRTASFDGNTKVVFVATASQSLKFHKAQAIRMRELGWEVDIISASGPELAEFASKGFHTTAIEMHREIAPLEDARCLAQFYRALKASKPQMVIAATPKASLLCVLAARAAGVPRIVFSLFGMRSETLKGWKAIVVRGLERLTARCADITIACSRSLQERAITSGIVDPSATVVLGSGGPSGIDVREFQVCAEHTLQACELRQQYGLHPDDFVIGFVGRLVRDKGIVELAEAFEQICHNRQGVKLVLVGGPEPTDPVPERTLRLLNQNPNVVQVAFTNDVRPWYAAFDAFVLPTYREGLPTVVLEAQAAGIPVVVTRATGTLDAVVEGTTAIVAEARDAESLRRNIELILDDPQGAARRVEAGREFVQREFDEQVVTWHYVNFYQHLARQKPTPASLPSVN